MSTLAFDAIDEMSSDEFLGLVAIVGGMIVLGIAVVFSLTYATVRKRATEQTRREIAAYVAEGSMTAEDAQTILEAGRSDPDLAVLMGVAPGGAKARRKQRA